MDHVLYAQLRGLHDDLQQIVVLLRQLATLQTAMIQKEIEMALDLTKLDAEVARNTTVIGSAKALLEQISDMLKAIPPSTDPTTQAAIDAIVTTLTTNDDTMASAVAANTPGAPAGTP